MFNYRVLTTTERTNPSWNYIEISRQIEITYDGQRETQSLMSLIVNIENTLFQAIADIGFRVDDSDMIKIMIRNETLVKDIWISFQRGSQLTRNVITNAIFKVCQSNIEFLFQGLLTVDIVIIKMPSGGGSKRKYGDTDLNSYERRSTKAIMIERDGLCCARSLVVGKAIADKLDGREWRRLKDDTGKIQLVAAKKLCTSAEIIAFSNCGIAELEKFQNILEGYRIVVMDAKTSTVIFKGPDSDKSIYLLYRDNHYYPTRSLKAFLGFDYFCEKCVKGYRERSNHKCVSTCKFCFGTPACTGMDEIECHTCYRTFCETNCYENHVKNKICNSLRKCLDCSRTYKSKRQHVCYKFYCNTCRELVESKRHFCYMVQPNLNKIRKEDLSYKAIVYYDIESTTSAEGIHTPNLLCSSHCCSYCEDNDNPGCILCERKEQVFEGYNCVEMFCKWIFKDLRKTLNDNVIQIESNNPKIFVIAHNGKAYDFHFVLQYLNDNHIAGTPKVIKSGSKIITMNFANVKFLDSVSFLPMPLKALPKAFGLSSQKGWFPHKFNLNENWNYVGPYPDIAFYDVDKLSPKERTELLDWYSEVKDKIFNFKDELIKYCALDVSILQRSFQKFRKSFREQTSIDPISRCITIAQACMEVYKCFFLPSKSIAIIPSRGYEPRRKSSVIGDFWLDWLSEKKSIVIIKEKKIGRYFVDGYHFESQTIYEFLGCFYHGCKKCYPNDREIASTTWLNKSMDTLYFNTMKKLEDLKTLGYEIEIMWECQFHENEMKEKSMIDRYEKYLQDKRNRKPPLNPRDAFFGGRTNAIKLFYETKNNEKIRYFDFTSLYPYVVKYCAFPKGHPEVIKFNLDYEGVDINNYDGFVLCQVSAPKKLYLPVLPVRVDGKLMFPLCVKCAKDRNQDDCLHSDQERAFVGTWTTPELKKALEKGYEILKIYEVWNFRELIKYDSVNKEGGFFSSFMDKWLKLKVESSGYPENIETESDKDSYIESYKSKEGIILDKNKIVKNPSLRTQAKLMANSFWGKFAQRTNLPQTVYLHEPADFLKLLSDSSKTVTDAFLVNNSTMMVQFEDNEEFIQDSKHSNVVIAAFTTTYARLKLYELLEKLEKRILYFDTDSVIYVETDNDEFRPKLGDYLGELTDELCDYGTGSYITKFVSGGPKNYAYEVKDPNCSNLNYCCKIKGITMNYKAREKLNFDTMEQLIKNSIRNQSEEKIHVEQLVFKSNKENQVQSNEYEKVYRLVYDKRRIIEQDYSTLPFGYTVM